MRNDRFGGQRSSGGGGGGGRGRGRGRYSNGGGGGGGGRRGGRGGERGGYRGGRGGRSGGGGRGGRHQRRSSPDSGNQRERIAVESGHLVFIDQFMLANPQFITKLSELVDEDPSKKNDLVSQYGGSVVELEPGTYRIERDPFALSIIIHPDGHRVEAEGISQRATQGFGHVFIDTRCVAMIDRELLDDIALLERYQQLWLSGQEKACRDLIRDNGGAVRYGFQRYGDELGVYAIPGEPVVCLWPDVAELPEAA